MKMTLVRRFVLTCSVILTVCCSAGLVALFCMVRTQQAVVTLNDYSVPGIYWAAQMSAIAKDQRAAVLVHLNSTKPTEMDELEARIEKANSQLAEGRAKYPVSTKEDAEQIAAMAAAQKQWMDAWYRIRELSRAGKMTDAWQIYYDDLMRATLARRKADDYLLTTSREQGFKAANAALSLAHSAIPLVLLMSVVAIAGSLGVSLWMGKHLQSQLKSLTQAAEKIALGDVSVNVEITGDVEVQELSRSFSSTAAYLREMAEISGQIAAGDLSNSVHPRCDNDALSHAFVQMTTGLAALVRSVRDSAMQVASASNQMAAAAGDTARGSVEASSAIDDVNATMHEMELNLQSVVGNTKSQSSSVSETAAAIEQLVASIQRVADTSTVLVDISNQSREEARGGVSSMEKAQDGLGRINASIQSSAEIIDALGNRAHEVGKIVGVIEDLADQTNLLALNAAIEAARAGEHGLGFNVVADEVRKLAEKSAQSTNEISQLISNMQKEVHSAVEKMNRSTVLVNEGLSLGGELRTSLTRIADVVRDVNRRAQEIGGATSEQSKGSTQIGVATSHLTKVTYEITASIEEQAAGTLAVVKTMDRMREIVQRYSSSSAELAASAGQMSQMSGRLITAMDSFRLADDEAAPRSTARARALLKRDVRRALQSAGS